MRRREFITLLGGTAAAWPLTASAQQPDRMRRMGVLIAVPENNAEQQEWVAAFMEALTKFGWNAGVNIHIEYRWSAGDNVRTQTYAAELVSLMPDVIFAQGTPVTMALKSATRTVPIVFVNVTDPVSSGLVESLAHPGGNLTGFTNFEYSMGGKWLELMKDIAPSVRRIAIILNPDSVATRPLLNSIESAAKTFDFEVIKVAVHDAGEIEREIGKLGAEKNIGLMALPDFIPLANRELIIALAMRYGMPSIFPFRIFATTGALMSLGIDTNDLFRRAASYVDRVLRGAKPQDLPIQAPTIFQLVINLKTAKALGLTVPPSLLARADEVIE
jgi:putative ABC transport system substrate-binding protein